MSFPFHFQYTVTLRQVFPYLIQFLDFYALSLVQVARPNPNHCLREAIIGEQELKFFEFQEVRLCVTIIGA